MIEGVVAFPEGFAGEQGYVLVGTAHPTILIQGNASPVQDLTWTFGGFRGTSLKNRSAG
jgi:hypothetical protein